RPLLHRPPPGGDRLGRPGHDPGARPARADRRRRPGPLPGQGRRPQPGRAGGSAGTGARPPRLTGGPLKRARPQPADGRLALYVWIVGGTIPAASFAGGSPVRRMLSFLAVAFVGASVLPTMA